MLQYVPAISLWCLGLYAAAEPHMVLHGLQLRLMEWAGRRKRQRLDEIASKLWSLEDMYGDEGLALQAEQLRIEMQSPVREWLVKPVLTCVACMSSLHGTLVLVLYAFVLNQPVRAIDGLVSIISSVFVTRFIWSLYELVKKATSNERVG